MDIHAKIINGDLDFPLEISQELQDLVCQVLVL